MANKCAVYDLPMTQYLSENEHIINAIVFMLKFIFKNDNNDNRQT